MRAGRGLGLIAITTVIAAAGLGARQGLAAGWSFLAGVVAGAPVVCLIGAGYLTELTGGGRAGQAIIAAALLLTVEYGDDKRPYIVDVVRVEPKGYVSYRWASAFGGAAPAQGTSTLVEFYVRPVGDEVGVTVVESGFASLDLPDALREDEWKGNTGGWQYEMAALRTRAERGR